MFVHIIESDWPCEVERWKQAGGDDHAVSYFLNLQSLFDREDDSFYSTSLHIYKQSTAKLESIASTSFRLKNILNILTVYLRVFFCASLVATTLYSFSRRSLRNMQARLDTCFV